MKYVKLGPNAQQGSFFDPVTKLSLAPGQVAKVPKLAKTSQIFKDAVKGQHIVAATEEEFDDFEEKLGAQKAEELKTSKKAKKKEKPALEEDEEETEESTDEDEEEDEDTEEETEDEGDEDEDDVDNMSKSELVAYLKESTMPDEEKKNLSKMNKEQLKTAFAQYNTKK